MLRVILLEDHLVIAWMFEDLLVELGHSVVGIGATSDTGLALVRDARPDVAIIDLHLADGPCYELVAELKSRDLPFVVITAAVIDPADKRLANIKILPKPIDADGLKAVVTEFSASVSGSRPRLR